MTLDTTRADRIGAYGGPATPHLDDLAARGTVFSSAWTVTPLTIPSHSSMFTGLYPPRHGVRDNGDLRLAAEATTLAEHLARAGLRTSAAVAAYVTQAHWGFGQGFDTYAEDLGVPGDRLSWRVERGADEVLVDALALLPESDFLWVHLFDAHKPYVDGYDAELARLDTAVGQLVEALPADATLLVVGDHGEGLGDEGEEEHGLLLHDATARVPLLAVGPGFPPATVDTPVSIADVFPTVLGHFGLEVPPDLDGVDLRAPEPDRRVYVETLYGQQHYGWSPLYGVATGKGLEVDTDPATLGWTELAAAAPAWQPEQATLDVAALEQLQALGYVAGPSEVTAPGLDPREGIELLKRMEDLHARSPGELVAELRGLLAQAPGMRDLRLRLAMTLARHGRPQEALAELATAYAMAPSSTIATVSGQIWLQAGAPGEALQWFREALDLDPRSVGARAGEVEALVLAGRLDEAALVADETLADTPDHARVRMARAGLALGRGEPIEPFAADIEELARERPLEPGIRLLGAALHAAAGDVDLAEERYQEELRWRPKDVTVRLELAALYRSQGRYLDEVKTLLPLTRLHPDEPRFRELVAQAYVDLERPDLAEPFSAPAR